MAAPAVEAAVAALKAERQAERLLDLRRAQTKAAVLEMAASKDYSRVRGDGGSDAADWDIANRMVTDMDKRKRVELGIVARGEMV